MERVIESLPALEEEAERLVHELVPGATATLVTLSGELGAGKTAFTKVVAKALGVEEVVNSPTFVLEKIYALPKGGAFARLVHIDAYRLENGAELATLGFDALMKDSKNLILLEWPEKVANDLPEPSCRVTLEALDSGARRITISP